MNPLLVVLLLCSIGASQAKPTLDRIVGGYAAAIGEFPYQVR